MVNTNGYNNCQVCKGIMRPQSLRIAALGHMSFCGTPVENVWAIGESFVTALFPELTSVKATIYPMYEMNLSLMLQC